MNKKYILSTKNNGGELIQFSTLFTREDFNSRPIHIKFLEDDSPQYPPRTRKNAQADITIAIAADFSTTGEKLTKKAVFAAGKKFIEVGIDNLALPEFTSDKIAEQLLEFKNSISINVAGNGIYTWTKYGVTQTQLDHDILLLFSRLMDKLPEGLSISVIKSGGQSGSDEAGAKAGIMLGIPTIVLAPKGFRFRDINNKDIYDRKKFIERFIPQMVTRNILENCSVDFNMDIFKKFISGKINLYLKKKSFDAAK